MIDKRTGLAEAVSKVRPGDTVMVGGFGVPGTPFTLINALLDTGADGLTLVKNEANEDHMGLSKLVEAGRARRLITSHLGLNKTVIAMMNRGEVEVEFHPQGILAEKIRAGGAGLFAFLHDVGLDCDLLCEQKTVIEHQGRRAILEPALNAEVALLHAARADTLGNLVYEKSARNFNPVMATAAALVIVEAEEVVPAGALDPQQIHTPGAFVDHVVELAEIGPEYGILEHHVL